jgi:16S rRNA (cytosine967-C5)-methyltransferase
MIPSARVAASIEILDTILAGDPPEKVMTRWGRANRYAGSGDRAAIRDQVFDVLRCKRSFGHLGGGETGRALMIGWARASDLDVGALFSGQKFAPDPLNEGELTIHELSTASRCVQSDWPDWLQARVDQDLGVDADSVLTHLQSRAPVYLRVNKSKAERSTAQDILAETDIDTQVLPKSETALRVTKNARRVSQSKAYLLGIVEIQDVSSQAVVDFLPLKNGDSVLDYCAGGGGKGLAMTALADISLTAHDIDPDRMRDLPARALRADVSIQLADSSELTGREFDLVLCDAPCSGSGSWRRSPYAKWALTPDRLAQLCEIQASILVEASKLVSSDGVLAYVSCSIFQEENGDQVEKFLAANSGWKMLQCKQWLPSDLGDGFFAALLKRD